MLQVDISIAGTLVRTVYVHGEKPDEHVDDVMARLKDSIMLSISENNTIWKPRDPIVVLSPRLTQ